MTIRILVRGVHVSRSITTRFNPDSSNTHFFLFLLHPIPVEMGGCGGALVAADIVLFAAHCGDWKDKQINIGAYKTRTRSTENGANGRFCEEWIPDPLFKTDGGFNNYDFALCKLDKPLEIDQSRVRLELNEDDLFPREGIELEVMGFGWLDIDQSVPQFLQYITVPYIADDVCMGVWGDLFTDNMLCAGHMDSDGKDACKGDSGGALIHRAIDNDGTIVDTHVGLVSYGVPCANEGLPSVYARTSSRIDWIKTTMCNDLESVAAFCDNNLSQKSKGECNGENLSVAFTTDDFGSETSWTLLDSNQNKVKERKYFVNNFEYETSLCLDSDECYTWELRDTYGDGMCTYRGCGSYAVTLNGENLFSGNGNFKFFETESFCTNFESPANTPSDAPSESPTQSDTSPRLSSESPSNSPTSSPSNAPSETPTKSHASPWLSCEDDENFRWDDRKSMNCRRFLRGRNKNRIKRKCKKIYRGMPVSRWCSQTCGIKAQEGPCPTMQIRR
jgi:hypothetical protein